MIAAISDAKKKLLLLRATLIRKQSLSLFRRKRFRTAALFKQWPMFSIVILGIALAVNSFGSDPSIVIRVCKILTACIALAYPFLRASTKTLEYEIKHRKALSAIELRQMSRKAAALTNQSSGPPKAASADLKR